MKVAVAAVQLPEAGENPGQRLRACDTTSQVGSDECSDDQDHLWSNENDDAAYNGEEYHYEDMDAIENARGIDFVAAQSAGGDPEQK